MLFSYILQFVPDRKEAGTLLVDVFSRLTPQLQDAFDSSLTVYCWLQVESRKIILEHIRDNGNAESVQQEIPSSIGGQTRSYYFSLLEDAPPEYQWVFRSCSSTGGKRRTGA